MTSSRALGAILVGGKASRMGGAPKGLLLTASGETVVARMARLLALVNLDVVLVGDRAEYRSLGYDCLADDPRAEGPLSGILAALTYAGDRPVVVVACDMPFVTEELLLRLVSHPSTSAIVAAGRATLPTGRRFEPLFARYQPEAVLPLALHRATLRDFSLQRLLDDAAAAAIDVDDQRHLLDDWDTPGDVSARDC